MNYRHFKHEGWLYILAFVIALALRFIQLGLMPISDAEALPALQALDITQGARPTLEPHPFYILSTSVLFFLFGGGTNFLARLIPAFIGSVLVFAPRLLFVDRIKPRPGVILAFFLALDPGLVAISRQAASPILAITFLLFALAYIDKHRADLVGIFGALALLSGPSIWQGVFSIGIPLAIFIGISQRQKAKMEEQAEPSSEPEIIDALLFEVRDAILPFIATFIIAGSLFFIIPNGLSAALGSLPAYIGSWLRTSDVSTSRIFLSLLVYQSLAVLLALIAMVRGWVTGSVRVIPISLWLIISLVIVIFMPSHQISDLAWTLVPLYTMAALELARSFDIHPEDRSEVFGVMFLTAFIWIFAWLDFSGMVWLPAGSREFITRFWLLLGALALIVISLVLVAAGWSVRIARIGGVWGMTLVLGVLGFSGTLGSAGLRGLSHPELWWQNALPMQAELLEATVREVSEIGLGNDFAAPVVINGIDSPALEWALREHSVRVVDTLDTSSSPYFVLTVDQTNPTLVSAYRGQDFSWRQTPLWSIANSGDWIRWIVLREMPMSGETIILWARDDLFLDK